MSRPERAPTKLLWRCRRGLREMDMLMLGYLDQRWAVAPEAEQASFEQLLDELDQDILDWLLGRAPVPENYRGLLPWLKLAACP